VDKRLLINIGLLSFIFLLSLILLNTDEDSNHELPRLSTIDQKDIVQIKVLRRDLDDFIFNKQIEAWHMSSPQQFLANNARINAMLRMLNVESHGQLDPKEVDLDNFGLSAPTVVMKLNDHEFKFGITDVIDQRRYVLFNGTIHLTNDFLYNQLMTNAAFFADNKLLPKNTEIVSIEYPENKLELNNDQWHTNPLLDISPDQLKRTVFNWKNASALSINKYEPSEAKPIITITTRKKESIKFDIISNEPPLILGRKDIGLQYNMATGETGKLLLHENANNSEEAESFELELR
jgi:uncharacterized protein DUF4340